MRFARYASLFCLLLLALAVSGASTRAQTGRPPFDSFTGGAPDTMNLGNLNVHLTLPIVHKPGRGLPFDYDLTYDSTIWTPTFLGYAYQWKPDTNWGWTVASSGVGYITHNTTVSVACADSFGTHAYVVREDTWVYWDGSHTRHPFDPNLYHTYWQSSPPGFGDSCAIPGSFTPSYSNITNASA